MNSQPIGIFDSGIGGTSIWKEIVELLPNENTIYLSDSKNAPYGEKSKKNILKLCIKNTELLLEKGCKIIVVACNTATTNAISYLRANYNVPFIGIEPAIKPASLQTKTKNIGVLATKGTLTSELFSKTSSLLNQDIQIHEQVGTGLVELIEKNRIDSKEMELLLRDLLANLLRKNIDCLVLGCTHYPYLIPKIKEIISDDIKIIDSGFAVARQTKAILQKHNLLNTITNNSNYLFLTNKDESILKLFVANSSKNIVVKEFQF